MTLKTFARLVCSAVGCCALIGTAQADPTPFDRVVAEMEPGALTIVYDADTGGLNAIAPPGHPFTAIELRSENLFLTGACENLDGAFDVCTDDKLFKLNADGFSETSFGTVLPPNVSPDDLLAGLRVDGASIGGGFKTGTGTTILHSALMIPEPTTLVLSLVGLMSTLFFVRLR